MAFRVIVVTALMAVVAAAKSRVIPLNNQDEDIANALAGVVAVNQELHGKMSSDDLEAEFQTGAAGSSSSTAAGGAGSSSSTAAGGAGSSSSTAAPGNSGPATLPEGTTELVDDTGGAQKLAITTALVLAVVNAANL
eukprot:Selendium_serpulae@DN6470_c0_g1_i1.p1